MAAGWRAPSCAGGSASCAPGCAWLKVPHLYCRRCISNPLLCRPDYSSGARSGADVALVLPAPLYGPAACVSSSQRIVHGNTCPARPRRRVWRVGLFLFLPATLQLSSSNRKSALTEGDHSPRLFWSHRMSVKAVPFRVTRRDSAPPFNSCEAHPMVWMKRLALVQQVTTTIMTYHIISRTTS